MFAEGAPAESFGAKQVTTHRAALPKAKNCWQLRGVAEKPGTNHYAFNQLVAGQGVW